MKDVKERSRLALYQHAMRVRHHKSRLWEIHINERFGDDGFEVKATEEKCPTHMQASTVLRGLINHGQEEK